MSMNPAAVGVVVAQTLISTAIQHPFRKLGKEKRELSFVEGVALIRRFLKYASHHDVHALQKLTAQTAPKPFWVKCEHEEVSKGMVEKAIGVLIAQLGEEGIEKCGGSKWWQWRKKNLKWERMEVRKRREDNETVIFYVHGGAYYFGSTDIHRYQIIRHLWSLPGSIAIAPRYRLAPQFPFPCGLLDILACYMQVERDFPGKKIVVMGDSAGGGLVLALLFIIRDQKLRMPNGGTLLSPWCDLTHSFPSIIGDNTGDYIPPAGFLHKPSIVWPPPVHSQMKSASQGEPVKSECAGLELANVNAGQNLTTHVRPDKAQNKSDVNEIRILIQGKEIVIHDQIQLYANNSLLNYYLVSPVVAKDFSGLCPLLVIGGAREVLRDEIMYIAHRAAHDGVKTQLMVFDEGCHVATTLSWTTIAKYQFRAAANFGVWCTGGQAKQVIKDDDRIRVRGRIAEFEDGAPTNFSRLRINTHGHARQMEPEEELACLKVENIGTIKAGPVTRWRRRKEKLDLRYKIQKDKVQRLRAKEIALSHESNERPPPSAAYGREWTQDEVIDTGHESRTSTAMALWSKVGLMSSFRKHSNHDSDDDKRNAHEREYDNMPEEEGERQ